jgi:2-dehydropantoate 2-reductase
LAALLAEGGQRVSLLDYRVERARAITRQGLQVVGLDGAERVVPVFCTADAEGLPPADLLVILTKAGATAKAVEGARAAVGAQTSVLTLQNGLGNYEVAQEVLNATPTGSCSERHTGETPVPPTGKSKRPAGDPSTGSGQAVAPALQGEGQVLAGTTASGATLLGVGRVQVAGIGGIVLGSPAGDRARAELAAEWLSVGELRAEVVEDVEAALWRKAIINAAINPLGALTGRRNGELLEDEGLRRLLGLVAGEAHQAALAAGMALEEMDPVAAVEQVCTATAQNLCSMLQDVRAGRRTEIDQINGEIARRAAAVGIETPLCEALRALVEGKVTGNGGPLPGGGDAAALP